MTLIPILISLLLAPKVEYIEVPVREYVNESLDEWEKLQLAIILTESKGDPNAVGKDGDFGLYQMIERYILEVNRVCHTDYSHEDAFDPDKAIKIFNDMQGYYNPGKDFDTALKYHNRSAAYRKAILQSLELVERYETVRQKLVDYGK